MSTVDDRVVRMTFDNAQFERGIKTTMETLSKFEKSLKLEGAAAGFDSLKAAADKLNLTGLSDNVKNEVNKIDTLTSDASKSFGAIENAASNVDMSDLEKSAATAINGVNDAVSQTDMSSVTKETQEAAEGFNAFETVAVGALLNLGGEITNFVENKLKGLANKINEYTFKPIAEGFGEYETQIRSIQTIMANTEMNFDSDADIDRVNTALDKLNTYADETIYNFTDMTEAIGTFTASGIGLDEAVDAVKGTANVAAFSGASASDFHRVLPQLAQALSSGIVGMQDWRSVETAHMASAGFRKAIGEVAMHMANQDLADPTAAIAGEALMAGGNMRSLLNKQENKDIAGWFTSDILKNALRVFTFDKTGKTTDEIDEMKKQLAELGYVEDEFEAVFNRAKMATRAATEVRTWHQLWDTVGEAIGSNWAGIWRNLIGDFKQATETFTYLSNIISDGISRLFSGITNVAQRFNKSGAIDVIFGRFQLEYDEATKTYYKIEDSGALGGLKRLPGVLDYVAEAIAKPSGAILDAFDNIFGYDTENPEAVKAFDEMLVGIALSVQDFAKSLIISDDAATGIRHIFEGLFSMLEIATQMAIDAGAIVGEVVRFIRTFTDPLVDIALVLGGQVGKVLTWIHDRFLDMRTVLVEVTEPLRQIIHVVEELISCFFDFLDIPGKIEDAGDGLINLLDVLWDFIDLPGKIREVFKTIGDFTGWNKAAEEANNIYAKTGEYVRAVDLWIDDLLQTPIGQFFVTLKDTIVKVFDAISNTFKTVYDTITGIFKPVDDVEKKIEETGNKIEQSKAKTVWDDIVGAIKVVLDILGTVLETIATILTVALVPLGDLLVAIVSGIGGAFGIIGNLISIVKDFVLTVGEALGLVFNLIGAIAGFASRIGEAFLQLEPVKNFLDGIVKVKDDVLNFFNGIPNAISGAGSGFAGLFGEGASALGNGIADWFKNTTEYFNTVTVEQFVEDVKTWVNDTIQNVRNLIDFFANLTPESLFGALYETLHGGLGDLGQIMLNIGDSIERNFPGIGTDIKQGIWNAYSEIIRGVNAISRFIEPIAKEADSIPDFILKLFVKIAEVIASKFNELKELVTKFSPAKLFTDWLSNFNFGNPENSPGAAFINGIYTSLQETARNIEAEFPSLHGIFTGGLASIYQGIRSAVDNITNFLRDVTTGETDWVGVFQNIWDKIIEGVSHLPEKIGEISNIIKDKFFEIVKNVSENLRELPGIFGEVFGFISDNVDGFKNNLDGMVKSIGDGFTLLKDLLGNGLDFILTNLEKIPGPIGDLFGTLHDTLGIVNKDVSDSKSIIPESISGAFSGINGPVDDAKNTIASFWKQLFNPEGEGDNGKETIIDKVKNFIIDKFEKIRIFIESIPDRFADGLARLKDFLWSVKDDILVVLVQITDALMSLGLARLLNSGATLMSKIGKYIGRLNHETLVDKVKGIAIALGILAGAVVALSLVEDPWKGVATLGAIAAIIAALSFVYGLIDRFMSDDVGDSILKASSSLLLLAVGLIGIMKAVEMLNGFDWLGNIKGVIGAGAIIAVLAGVATLMSKFGGNKRGGGGIIEAALGVSLLAASLYIIAPAIEQLIEFAKGIKSEELDVVLRVLAAVFAGIMVLALGLRLAGEHGISAGVGLILFAVALGMVADTLVKIVNSCDNIVAIDTAALDLFAIVGAFGLIAKLCKPSEMIAAGVAIGMYAIAIQNIGNALTEIASKDWLKIESASLGISVIVGLFLALTKLASPKELIAAGAGMIIYAAALGVITLELLKLTSVDPGALLASSVALGALIGVFGAVVAFTKEADLLTSAFAIGVYSAALGVLSISLINLSQVPDLLPATVSLGALVGVFGAIVALTGEADLLTSAFAIGVYSVSLGVMTFALMNLANVPSDQLGSVVLCLSVLVGVFGVLAALTNGLDLVLTAAGIAGFGAALVVVAMGITALSEAIKNLPTEEQFHSIGYNVIAGFAGGIIDGIAQIPIIIAEAVKRVVDYFKNLLGIHSPSTVMADEVGQYIPEGISEGILGNSDTIGDSLGGLLGSLTENESINGALDGVFSGLGEKFKGFIAGIPEWFKNEGLPMLGQMASDLWNWFMTEGLPMLGNLLNEFWNWFNTEGIPILLNAGKWILDRLGELAQNFMKWMQTDGLPALGKALSDFWDWFQKEGLPAIGKAIEGLFGALGDLLKRFGEWVLNEGLPALGKALGDFLQDVLKWVEGLPGEIGKAIEGIGDKLIEVGGDILNGIIQGITGGAQEVLNGAGEVAGNVVDAFCNFFGINSPSKLMRDTIGLGIDEGIAAGIEKYASYALDSVNTFGTELTNKLQNSVDTTDISGNVGIRPVVDAGAVNDAFDAVDRRFKFNNAFDMMNNMNIDFGSSLGEIMNEQSSKIESLISENARLREELNGLRGDMSEYNDAISNLSIVMDTGTLVGAVSPMMDNAIGRRQVYAKRGIF